MDRIRQIKKIQNFTIIERINKLLRFFIKYVSPFITITSISLIKLIVDPSGNIGSFSFFNIPILIHAWLGGFIPGVLTSLLSTLTIFLIFTDPKFSLDKGNDQMLRIFFFLIQSFVLVFIVNKLNKSRLAIKNVNETINNERERIQHIIDNIFTFIVVVSPDGKIIEANKATIELGPKNTVIGKNVYDIYPWSYNSNVQQKLNQSIVESLTGKSIRYDEKMRVSDDKNIDVLISIDPIFDKNNKANYIIISATDITERKAYERELETVHQNYKKLINSNIIGMVIRDKENNILEVNNAFLNMIGYEKKDIENGSVKWTTINHEKNWEKEVNLLNKILETGYAASIEREFLHKDGSGVPVISSAVLIDEDQGHVLCVILDITERKKLEQKKDEFLSIASHELKTPLTTLKGYVQLLGSKLEDRQNENEMFIARMDKQLIKITDLINDLLDISRIQTGGLTFNNSEFDIVELAEEVILEVSPLTNRHKIHIYIPENEQIVLGDRTRIGQVIINLLSNAIKYSPNSDKINLYVRDNGNEVEILVEDFGVGIPSDKINKLFQKFYRVEENQSNWHQGLGLGLYISNQIIQRHKSVIQVKSELNQGSIFYFSLSKVNGSEK